jgi:tetratricopeptide (TPR) repeat protein
MSSRSYKFIVASSLAATLLVVGAFGVTRSNSDETTVVDSPLPAVEVSNVIGAAGPPAADLDQLVEQLQARLDVIPADHVAWATLGIAYVQQARVTADPSYYARADGALDESFDVRPDDNFLAFAGRSTLASARHEFADAKNFAEQGLEINGFSAILLGALSDAEVQLGRYDAADAATSRMLELQPDTPAYARASYLAELRGDIAGATTLMQQALEGAGTPSDRAFALTILGDLSFNAGAPGDALTLYNRAREQSPDDALALAGKARAEAALGQIETALDHYGELVETAPEPSYLIAYARLLESVGRVDEAAEQYALVDTVQQLFEANGVEADAAPILDLADRGDPAEALREAETAVASRPFLLIHDAHAWALHANDRDDEALVAIDLALALGTLDAKIWFHSGMIKHSLGDSNGAREDLRTALDINPFFDPLDAVVAKATLVELGDPA